MFRVLAGYFLTVINNDSLFSASCGGTISITDTTRKITWQWNITLFKRRYIFKCFFLHCHVSLGGVRLVFASLPSQQVACFLMASQALILSIMKRRVRNFFAVLVPRWWRRGRVFLILLWYFCEFVVVGNPKQLPNRIYMMIWSFFWFQIGSPHTFFLGDCSVHGWFPWR